MKTNSIKYDFTSKQGYSSVHRGPQIFKEKSAGLCEKNNADKSVTFSGGLTRMSEAAANCFNINPLNAASSSRGGLFKKKWFDSFLRYADAHNIGCSALMSLILAGALRPATIMALPGKKDKEDKIYASGHSIASGIIGFGFSTLLTTPLDIAVKKLFEDAKEKLPIPKEGIPKGAKRSDYTKFNMGILNKKYLRLAELKKMAAEATTEAEKKAIKQQINALELSMKNIAEWVIAVPRAMLTIALIPLVLKYVFGLEKKKKPAAPAQQEQQNLSKAVQDEAVRHFMQNKNINDFKGGNK